MFNIPTIGNWQHFLGMVPKIKHHQSPKDSAFFYLFWITVYITAWSRPFRLFRRTSFSSLLAWGFLLAKPCRRSPNRESLSWLPIYFVGCEIWEWRKDWYWKATLPILLYISSYFTNASSLGGNWRISEYGRLTILALLAGSWWTAHYYAVAWMLPLDTAPHSDSDTIFLRFFSTSLITKLTSWPKAFLLTIRFSQCAECGFASRYCSKSSHFRHQLPRFRLRYSSSATQFISPTGPTNT